MDLGFVSNCFFFVVQSARLGNASVVYLFVLDELARCAWGWMPDARCQADKGMCLSSLAS